VSTYIALLRAIGGNYTLPMKGLVELLEGMELSDVRTYIQTGNAVFRSEELGPSELPEGISAEIEKRYGFAPRVIALTPQELKEAVASNPYPEAEPRTLHLTFLASTPEDPDLAALERLRKDNERFALEGRTFYFHALTASGSRSSLRVSRGRWASPERRGTGGRSPGSPRWWTRRADHRTGARAVRERGAPLAG
jgi:uncharacterized protein (DUF1697 family)